MPAIRAFFETHAPLNRSTYLQRTALLLVLLLLVEAVARLFANPNAALFISTLLSAPVWAAGFCLAICRARDVGLKSTFVANMYGLTVAGTAIAYLAAESNHLMLLLAGLTMLISGIVMNLALAIKDTKQDIVNA